MTDEWSQKSDPHRRFCSAPIKMHSGLHRIWSTELMIFLRNSLPAKILIHIEEFCLQRPTTCTMDDCLDFDAVDWNCTVTFYSSSSQHGARISDSPPHFRAESEPTRCAVFCGRHHRDLPGRPQPRVLEHRSKVAENHLRDSGCRWDLRDRVVAQPEASRGRRAHVFVRESAPWIQQRLHQIPTRR